MGESDRKLKLGWNKSDFIICQLIANLAVARLEVILNKIGSDEKSKVLSNTLLFVKSFINIINIKEVLTTVKNELPQLLGY